MLFVFRGGGGGGDYEPTKLLYHPKQNLGRGPQKPAAKSLYWSI
jgi:hypothetical protein